MALRLHILLKTKEFIMLLKMTVYLLLSLMPISALSEEGTDCKKILKGYEPLPNLQVAAVEQEISRALNHFFAENPRAESIFRTALYGHDRQSINTTLVVALENIPASQRAIVVREMLVEVLINKFAFHPDFKEKVIEASLEINNSTRLLEQPTYFYPDLLKILHVTKYKGYPVLVFRDGRGEYAVIYDKTKTWYYSLDKKTYKAQPIDETAFKDAFAWRRRSISQSSSGELIDTVLKKFGLRSQTSPTIDLVQGYERILRRPQLKLAWRYLMNSLSDESYSLALHLLKQGTLSFDFNMVDTGLLSHNLSYFVKAIWEKAQRAGYNVKLDSSEYADSELDEILNMYGFHQASMNSGDEGYRVVKFGEENLYFLKEYTADNQLVFRKKTGAEFAQYQSQGETRVKELFKRYEEVSAITAGASLERFPEQIVSIPDEQLALLQVALNPGYAAMSGFKQANENLTDLIRRDAETVAKLGYTHKRLAEWLAQIIKSAEKNPMITLNGRRFEVIVKGYMGAQFSPFGDQVGWSRDYIVLDLKSGKRIRFSEGHPYMIGYYGFFEGNVEYRLPPDELIAFIEGR